MTEQNDSKKFHTIDGTVIMNKQMPPLRYTIAEILPAGLTLFSGDSKIGKSLLAVNMCVAVSKGEPFLDFPTHRGTVLYLALEDTESRIQRRVFSLTDTLDSNFHFSNERYRLDDGLIEAMEDFVTEHPDTNLIVIDVLQYIRPQSKGGNVYKEDYNDMIPLHEFTQRHHNLSLVLIHHTNKSNVSDQLRASSGSTAIVGAVDNYWLLQRPMRALRSGSLYCSGREISDKEIRLSLNESGIWIPKDPDNYKGEVLSSVVVGTYLWVMWHTDILDIDEKTGKHRLEYMQPSKTFDEDEQLAYISGYNCVPELANESFLATQKVFGHEPGGVRFYHFVQSFKIGEAISPQEANDIGMELVRSFDQFKNHEAIVATHIDRYHLHNHIVVSAYDLESGLKLHYNKYFLGDLRNLSDRICLEHGLEVLPKYDPNVKSNRMKPNEWHAAMRGNSWKMSLRVTIDFCMTRAGNKEEFIAELKKKNCEVTWKDSRKNITFIYYTEDGKEHRVRDDNLNDDKYLKENIENEFRIRSELYGQVQGDEYAASNTRRTAEGSTGADSSDGADQRRGMDAANGNATQNGGTVSGFDRAESQFEDLSGELRHGDEEDGRGAERGDGEGSAQDYERSDRTGWESERESFRSYRQKNSSGRGNMVSSSRNHVHSTNIDTALMGIRGIANVTEGLFEDGEESEEEKREREARNAGTAVGVIAGGITGIAIGLHQNHEPNIENNDDEDEAPKMGMTM